MIYRSEFSLGDGHSAPVATDITSAASARFFRTPFVKKERIEDTLASLEKLRASVQER